MRLLLTMMLAAGVLPGLDNAVTVYEASGAAQAARPLLLSRVFAKGEFPAGTFPKPRVDGAEPAAWQAEVKATWPDGSVLHALIATRVTLGANGAAVVDFVKSTNACHLGSKAACEAAAMDQAAMLARSWDGQMEATLNSVTHVRNARAMLGTGSFTYWLKGPVVTQAIVEDRSAAWPQNFGWQWDGSAWVTAGSEQHKSLLPAFGLTFWPDPDGAGSLTEWGGVEVEAALWNGMTTRMQRAPLDSLVVKTGSGLGTTAYTQAPADFIARRSWHNVSWSGTAPGEIVVDPNMRYLMHTRLLPQYDTSTPQDVAGLIAGYDSKMGADTDISFCTNAANCGNWMKATSTGGLRQEIQYQPKVYVDYLLAVGDAGVSVALKLEAWKKLVIGNADGLTSMPMHYIESSETKAAYRGHPVTLSARPTVISFIDGGGNNYEEVGSQVTAGDRIYPVCTADPCNGRLNGAGAIYRSGWDYSGLTSGLSHSADYTTLPYVLTGSWFRLRENQHHAAFATITNPSAYRKNELGLIFEHANWRGVPWYHRLAWSGAVFSPDGDPLKGYFRQILLNVEKQWEGFFKIADGNQPPADAACPGFSVSTSTDPWCIGRYHNLASGPVSADNPLQFSHRGEVTPSEAEMFWVDPSLVKYGTSPFMASYAASSWSQFAESGAVAAGNGQPAFKHVQRELGKWWIGSVLGPTRYFYTGFYRMPFTKISGAGYAYFSSWAEYEGVYKATESVPDSLAADITSTALSLVLASRRYTQVFGGLLRVDNEWMRVCGYTANAPVAGQSTWTICAGGRGALGSTAAAHAALAPVVMEYGGQHSSSAISEVPSGYAQMVKNALSFFTGQSNEFGTGSRAYQLLDGAVGGRSIRYSNFEFLPREEIGRVRMEAGSGAVKLRWVAPTGEPCRVYFGVAEAADSSDAGDAAATAPSREQSHDVVGAGSGTRHYRITCGTARVKGTTMLP